MKNEYRVGMFFMVGIVVLVFVMDFLGDVPFYSNTKTVYTYFDSLGELREGNPVKMEGLIVGKVSSIDLEGRQLKVSMKVIKDAPVKTDSIATIQMASLLGSSYVNLSFGSEETPLNNGEFPLASIDPTDLNEVLAKLDTAIGSLDSALGMFGGFGENEENINDIVSNLDIVLEDLVEGKGTLGKLIKDDTLYEETTVAMKNIKNISAKLSDPDGTFGKLINDDTLYVEATEAATNMNEVLEKINDGKGTLGKLVNDDALYYDTQNTILKAEKGIDTLEDLAPLGTLGAIFGVLTLF